jgi:hypothetical protein
MTVPVGQDGRGGLRHVQSIPTKTAELRAKISKNDFPEQEAGTLFQEMQYS